MAVNLARSFLWWHKGSDIQFYLITDQPQLISHDVRNLINIKSFKPGSKGDGFSTKLFIDEFIQTKYNLFIDADCLIYGKLDTIFENFKGNTVSAIGDDIYDGEFFCNVSKVRQLLNIDYLPRFVGGVYYLEKNELSNKVFEKARQLLPLYDHMGLKRLRGKENEEPLLAMAMAIHGQHTIKDDGTIKADRMSYTTLSSNVLSGKTQLKNGDFFPTWVKLKNVNPLIIHFNGSYTTSFEYKAEALRLLKVNNKQMKPELIDIFVWLNIILPGKSKVLLKDLFRPIFRVIFGYRAIYSIDR